MRDFGSAHIWLEVPWALSFITTRRILYFPRILSPDAPINSEGSQDEVARVTLVVWVCKYLSQIDRYAEIRPTVCNGRFVKDTYTPKPQM